MNNAHSALSMASVKKHLPILKLVQSASPKLRKSIVSNCDLDFINTLVECVFNSVNGHIPLSESEKKKLKKFKTILRKVLKTKGGLCKKRKVIVQNGGGFLPVLLQPIVLAGEQVFNAGK